MPREKVNPGVFIAIFLVVIILINYLGIRYFGEIEFWLSSAKILTIVGLLILSLVLVLGGGPDHDRKGFRYWNDPGAMKTLYGTGDKGRFLGLWSTFVTATFAFLGWVSLAGRSAGTNHRQNRACWCDCRRSTEPTTCHSTCDQTDVLANRCLLCAISAFVS